MWPWLERLLPPLHVYTDGSFKDGRGSWAFVVVRRGRIVAERSGKAKNTTSNRMEFQAALEALRFLSPSRRAFISTDSRVLLEALEEIPVWKAQNWVKSRGQPIPGLDQIQALDRLLAGRQISWRWVKAHSGVYFNERCDELCSLARQSVRSPGSF